MTFCRGRFERYYKDPVEKEWAQVIDSLGHSHRKTDDKTDYVDHIDIDSLDSTGDMFRWEVKDAKRIYRGGEKQIRLILLEDTTVADKNGQSHPGWGRGKAHHLVQKLGEGEWLIVPMPRVVELMGEVDWSKVYFKESDGVREKVCYTRPATFDRGSREQLMADGKTRLTRGDKVAHFALSYILTFKDAKIMRTGEPLPVKGGKHGTTVRSSNSAPVVVRRQNVLNPFCNT